MEATIVRTQAPGPAPLANLRGQVADEVRRRWVQPVASSHVNVLPDEVDACARAALDAMLVRTYRVTPRPSEDEYDQLLSRVRHWVRRCRPIEIMLGYAPLKNPKTTYHTGADWAEFFALCHLADWHNKVTTVYPPGLRIKIIFDDSTIRMANRYLRSPMVDYMGSVARLIRELRYESFLVGTMRQSSFAWLFHFGLYQWAGLRVRRWERDPENRPALERMLEFARRNLAVPPQGNDVERERHFRDAAHRYRVYWEALQLSGLSRLGHKLIAMYLDGSQHHLRQRAALHLTSLGKGQITQPWQGEGALLDNGHGKLVPTVLTGKRQEEFDVREMVLTGVLPVPGFNSIRVCYNRTKT